VRAERGAKPHACGLLTPMAWCRRRIVARDVPHADVAAPGSAHQPSAVRTELEALVIRLGALGQLDGSLGRVAQVPQADHRAGLTLGGQPAAVATERDGMG